MKKEYFLLIVAIIALLAYLFFHNNNKDNYSLPQLTGLDEADITSIEIIKDGDTIDCFKDNGKWVVTKEKYPGSTFQIKEMLSSIKNLTITTLISENKNLNRYDLDRKKAIRVIAKDKDKILRSFNVGKTAPTRRHTFITLDDDEIIYHARGNLRQTFNKSINNLRDKQIQKIDPRKIKSIEIRKNGLKKIINRKNTRKNKNGKDKPDNGKEQILWTDKDNNSIKQGPVKNLIKAMSDLYCDSYPENLNKKEFESKASFLKVVLKTDKTIEFTLFPKNKKGKYPGISSSNKYLFLLNNYVADDIISQVNELLDIKKENKNEGKS